MDPLTKALLLSWDLRVEAIALLLTLGTLHVIGWRNLRQRGRTRFANYWRLASYLVGLLLLAIALMSPIDVLGSQLFLMHMVQHLLMMMFAAPLLMLANPFPTFLWALPRDLRIRIGGWFQPGHRVYQTLAQILNPGLAWMLFITVYLGWHDPNLYNLALRNGFVHDVQHITFFGVAMLFWWRITGAGPQIGKRQPNLVRAAYAISLVPPNMLAGLAITFASSPIYSHYTTVPRLYGLSVMDDQVWSGLIMWIPGSMMYILAAIFLIGIQMNQTKKRTAQSAERAAEMRAAGIDLEERRQARWRHTHELRSTEA
ncbi:MAG: cytochrome c oxidase assembly protein [Caldilineaceae bacterium]|nr:cytochrome c oxidase assembly protein [Caldilineaceae bacterium]